MRYGSNNWLSPNLKISNFYEEVNRIFIYAGIQIYFFMENLIYVLKF